ncbi:hypothetical protein SAMN05660359_01832 [Geodermatophilus obscurus]|uniref:Uncharacterized protein n=1 Tax=Geodermatophilus obscurus TaxID=1861 RepID=A0A1I5F359_9ACTN|nr:hypothetical protein SAMN05660359_01832 [Geodermatophilus obscurus]
MQQERTGRALMGVVAATGLVYPLLLCAVQLALAQLFVVDVGATVLWLGVSLACSVALVAAVRWGAARRVRSPWLLLGLVPPVLYEVWVLWPLLTR